MAEQKLSDQLLSQLHEQYAINDNAKNQNFITFLIAMFALLGTYGYVYVHTYIGCLCCTFDNAHIQIIDNVEMYHPSVLITLTVILELIFIFLAVLVTSLGYSTRRDHIIIHNIRVNSMDKNNMDSIFGKSLYSPIDKGRLSFIPDYYNLFFFAFVAICFMLIVLLYIKLYGVYSQCPFITNCFSCCIVSVLFWSTFVLLPIFIYRNHLYKKYRKSLENNINKLK